MTHAERRAIHEVMVRFADGDRAAFREVFDALWPLLVAFTARALPIHADAEDAAQRALIKVFDRIADMDRARDGVAWALTIATYEVMTLRKQRARRRERSAALPVESPDHDALADEQLAQRELRAALHATIGELSLADQAALTQLLEEVAPSGETERKRRWRAIERLRALFGKAHG